MSNFQDFTDKELRGLTETMAGRLQADKEEAVLISRDLAILYNLVVTGKVQSEPAALAVKDFISSLQMGNEGTVELREYLSSDSGEDALTDQGQRFLSHFFGQKLPGVLQSIKSRSNLTPSVTQQMAKFTAAAYSQHLHRTLKVTDDPVQLKSILDKMQADSAALANERTNGILLAYQGEIQSRPQSGAVPGEAGLFQRILPWIFLTLAALMLLFILNRGCSAEKPENQSGDVIIHEM